MKWSSVVVALAAPLALAGSVERDLSFAHRRNNVETLEVDSSKSSQESKSKHSSYKGKNRGSSDVKIDETVVFEEVIVIWENNGGGATTSTVNSASTAAGAAAISTHTVIVGGEAGFVYTPNSISAAVGDMVVFQFESQNHTATQSAFTTPCDHLTGGTDTGFKPNPNNTVSPPPQVAIQVKVSTPLWFYCKQKGHCGKGMTFSINPTANKTQAMFEQMAIAQNGTGSTAGIVGGTSSTTTAALPPASAPPAATAGATGVVAGTGSGSGDACSCSCLCGVGSFPGTGQGVSAFGGMPGSIPAPALLRV